MNYSVWPSKKFVFLVDQMMATTAGQSFKQENVLKLLFSETTEPFESKVYRWQTQRDNNSYHDPLGRRAKKKPDTWLQFL